MSSTERRRSSPIDSTPCARIRRVTFAFSTYSGVGCQASSAMEHDSMIGTGRSADVYARGAGEVLRRYRVPRDTEREVAAMEHARSHGYPVPAARALSDSEIVMDRLDGPTMLDDLGRRPWRIGRHAALLA